MAPVPHARRWGLSLALLLVPALPAAPLCAQAQVPTASGSTAPICTDRPTKSNFACTVPAGRVQVEADTLSWLRSDDAGGRLDQIAMANTTLKFGLSGRSDIQISWSPRLLVRRRDGAGQLARRQGIGDVTLRFKQRLTPSEGAFQLALLPFVKLPTAPAGIGNRRVEGGMAVPVNISVPGGWTVTLGPQLDVLADADGRGRHLGVTGLVNLARQFGDVTLYNELWTSQNFDPAGTVRQYSWDVSLAWLARPTLQFDIGAHVGLNPATPDLVTYLGVSARF